MQVSICLRGYFEIIKGRNFTFFSRKKINSKNFNSVDR